MSMSQVHTIDENKQFHIHDHQAVIDAIQSNTPGILYSLHSLIHQFNYNSKITFTVCQLNTIQIAWSCITNKQTKNYSIGN